MTEKVSKPVSKKKKKDRPLYTVYRGDSHIKIKQIKA